MHDSLPTRIRVPRYVLPLVVLPLLVAGCATPGTPDSPSPTRASTNAELRSVHQLVNEGRYYEAIPMLHQIIVRAPESPAAIEGRYLLGVTYAQVASHRDAIEVLTEYLEQAPDGRYADEARELRARVQNQ